VQTLSAELTQVDEVDDAIILFTERLNALAHCDISAVRATVFFCAFFLLRTDAANTSIRLR
jgi:hypothetical protein